MSGYANRKFNDIAPAGSLRLGAVRSSRQLSDGLTASVVGQSEAIDAVVRALTIAGAQLADPERPLATLLLAGPTGVGKTEIVRQVAALVRSGPDDLCRIDMNSLAQEHYSASLAGAPPGYAGSKESMSLFQPERIEGNASTPGIVLFDEVEKAHATVVRSLLQVTDTGVLRLAGRGRDISFRNCLVFMTSNLGSRELARRQRSRHRRLVRRLMGPRIDDTLASRDRAAAAAVIRDHFDPELYNRFDEVVHFGSLDRAAAQDIVSTELDRLVRSLGSRGIMWSADDPVRAHLLQHGFDPTFGARNLRRVIRRDLHGPLSTAIIDAARTSGEALVLETRVESGSIVVRVCG